MKKFPARIWLFLLLALPLVSLWGEERGTLTFRGAYQRALIQSESVAKQEELIRAAEGRYLQALGTALPRLTAQATELIQDIGEEGTSGSSISTFTRRSRPDVAINLSQHLFQGFREFRALKVGGAEKEKNRLLLDRARQLLLKDVAQAYDAVLKLEKEREIQRSIRSTLKQRVAELKERVRLGKSRESDLLSTEAQLASAEAEVAKEEGLVTTARDLLGFLVGKEVTEPLLDEFQVPATSPPVEDFLAKLTKRSDLLASSEEVERTQGQLSYEKGGRYPTLDLSANYYPYRVGFLRDINWDVNFLLKVPIFQGGTTHGKIREARAGLKQAELSHQLANRQAALEVKEAYHRLVAARAQEANRRRAEAKGEGAWQALRREEERSLVNNLDVLEALRQWQSERLSANEAHFQTKLNYLELLIATGDLGGFEKP